MSLDTSQALKLELSRQKVHFVRLKIAFRVSDVEKAVRRVEGQCSDGGSRESKRPVVLVLLQEDDLNLAVVETSNNDYFFFETGERDKGRQLLEVKSCSH